MRGLCIFSSYRYYAKGNYDIIVTYDPAYLGLSDSIEGRRKQYIEFVVDESIINKEKLIKHSFIGSEYFTARLEEYYKIRNEKIRIGRPKKTEN